VSCIRNATEGLQLFRNELRKFNEHYKPNIEQIRRKYSENPLNQAPPECRRSIQNQPVGVELKPATFFL